MTGAPARIAHVVLRLDIGGLERVVLGLLERTRRDRFSPVVCALDGAGALAPELSRLDVPLVLLPRRAGVDPLLPARLAAWMRRERVRLVHTHNPGPHLYGALGAALAGARGPRPRVVHTKHGRNPGRARRHVLAGRLAAALTDRVVAVSDDARAIALEVDRIDPARIVTILNGIDTDALRPGGDPRAARARLGAPLRGFHVGCVARLSPEKDHPTLLEAFSLARAARPDAHLTLVGDGPSRASIEAHAARLGIERAVTFAGARNDVPTLLAAFDVFILTSRTEGISLTLLEAAAAGLPVVATRVGGNPEVVRDGETGLLVPPGAPRQIADALEAIAAHPDRAAMGLLGRDLVVRRFGADRMACAYEDLYARLLSGRHSAA